MDAQAGLSLHLSKCHIVGNHMLQLNYNFRNVRRVREIFEKYSVRNTTDTGSEDGSIDGELTKINNVLMVR